MFSFWCQNWRYFLIQCLGIIPYPLVLKIVVTIPGTTMPMLIHPKKQWFKFNRLPSWQKKRKSNCLKTEKRQKLSIWSFFNPKKAQNMDLIFCNLQKFKKHESYFLKATKSKHYEFDFFSRLKNLKKHGSNFCELKKSHKPWIYFLFIFFFCKLEKTH